MMNNVTDVKSTNPLDVLINAAFFKSGTGIREEHTNRVDGESAHSDYHSTLSSQIPPSRPLGRYRDWGSKKVDTNTIGDNAESLPSQVALPDQVSSRGYGEFGSNISSASTSNDKAYIRNSYIAPLVFHGDWRSESDNSCRSRIMEKISKLILAKRANKSPPKNLCTMVKQVELFLYRGAPNVVSYADSLTLERRLDCLASVLKRKLKDPEPKKVIQPDTSSVMGTLSFSDVGSKKHRTMSSPDVTLSNPHGKVQFQVRLKQGYSYAA